MGRAHDRFRERWPSPAGRALPARKSGNEAHGAGRETISLQGETLRPRQAQLPDRARSGEILGDRHGAARSGTGLSPPTSPSPRRKALVANRPDHPCPPYRATSRSPARASLVFDVNGPVTIDRAEDRQSAVSQAANYPTAAGGARSTAGWAPIPRRQKPPPPQPKGKVAPKPPEGWCGLAPHHQRAASGVRGGGSRARRGGWRQSSR